MIKAIETRYKGYRFRSRLEARWAVFFDTLGIEWEYEPEGYQLGIWGNYLPDFFIPLCVGYVEVKHSWYGPKDTEKIQALARTSGYLGFVVSSFDPEKKDIFSIRFVDGKEYLYVHDEDASLTFWTALHLATYPHEKVEFRDFCGGKLRAAYEAARSARFEHGECG